MKNFLHNRIISKVYNRKSVEPLYVTNIEVMVDRTHLHATNNSPRLGVYYSLQ